MVWMGTCTAMGAGIREYFVWLHLRVKLPGLAQARSAQPAGEAERAQGAPAHQPGRHHRGGAAAACGARGGTRARAGPYAGPRRGHGGVARVGSCGRALGSRTCSAAQGTWLGCQELGGAAVCGACGGGATRAAFSAGGTAAIGRVLVWTPQPHRRCSLSRLWRGRSVRAVTRLRRNPLALAITLEAVPWQGLLGSSVYMMWAD